MKENRAYGLKTTLVYEGGYVNDKRDPGGETNYGVTKATAKANGYTGDMHTIPMSVVENIYMNKFWSTPYYDADTLAAGVDICTFDFGVHSGPSRSGKYLKQVQGPDPVAVVKKLSEARLSFLRGLSVFKTYGKGFVSRVTSLEAKGVRLAQAATGKSNEAVKQDLNKDAADAKSQRTKEVVKAGGTGGAGDVAHSNVPDPTSAPDPHSIDWHSLLAAGEWVLFAAVVIAVAVFGFRAYIQHKRSVAFAAEAQGVPQ